jgi:hypothetical protein
MAQSRPDVLHNPQPSPEKTSPPASQPKPSKRFWFGRLLSKLLIPKLPLQFKVIILLALIAVGAVLWDRLWLQSETFQALARVDPVPHARELVAEERYAEAHDYLAFFMEYEYVRSDPEAVELFQAIEARRNDYRYRVKKAAEGALFGVSDELEGQVAAVVTDFFVFGDIRDVTLESIKWAKGEKVDRLNAALSAIGLAATAGSWMTAGGTLSAKPAISFLKMANKVDEVPPWLRKELLRSAKLLKQGNKLDNTAELLNAVQTLFKRSGVRSTLVLLDKAEDTRSLRRLTDFGATFGKQSATLLDLTGTTGIVAFKNLDNVPKNVFLEAATFGPKGVSKLAEVGPGRFQRFLRHTKLIARSSKVAYKHHEFLLASTLQILRQTLGRLPTWGLLLIMGYGVALIIRR